MLISVILLVIWAVGAGVYLALSILEVPDFVPSHLIKISLLKAALWPLMLTWLALTITWHYITTLKWPKKTAYRIFNIQKTSE